MLRIERSASGEVVCTLSGRMQTEDIEQMQQLLVVETPGQLVMFDLRDVTLVNQEAVTFLADCEVKGIELKVVLSISEIGSNKRGAGTGGGGRKEIRSEARERARLG
jgi:hypothetical protein